MALLYCPGYRIETLEFNIKDRDLLQPWVPPFKKLPITSLNGRLVDSRNRPIKDVKLVLYYRLYEVVHFDGQMDRSVPRLYITSALTDDVGAFSMNVPTLMDDPFIINNKWHFPQRLTLTALRAVRNKNLDADIARNIPLKRAYEDTLVFYMKDYAKLSGSIGNIFWNEHNIKGKIGWKAAKMLGDTYWVTLYLYTKDREDDTDEDIFYMSKFNQDRTFLCEPPPGTYNLFLCIYEKEYGLRRKVLVKENIVLEENKEVVVNVE